MYTAMLIGCLWAWIIQLKFKALVSMQKRTWYLWGCWQRQWQLGWVNDPAHTIYCVQMLTIVVSTLMWNSFSLRSLGELLSFWLTGLEEASSVIGTRVLSKMENLTLQQLLDIQVEGKKSLPTWSPAACKEKSGSAPGGSQILSHRTWFSKLAVWALSPLPFSYLQREQGKGGDVSHISSWCGEGTVQLTFHIWKPKIIWVRQKSN